MQQIHLDRWAELLEFQKQIKPFSPTLDEIGKLWGFGASRKSSAPRNTLEILEKNGYVLSRKPFGRCTLYYAIDPLEGEN